MGGIAMDLNFFYYYTPSPERAHAERVIAHRQQEGDLIAIEKQCALGRQLLGFVWFGSTMSIL